MARTTVAELHLKLITSPNPCSTSVVLDNLEPADTVALDHRGEAEREK